MDSRSVTVSSSSRPPAGGSRGVLEAAFAAMQHGAAATLAVVMETEGSTYVRPGALALFGGGAQVGWLSGGCLEPEIAARAEVVARDGRIEWMDVDTRDDEDLLAGSALGCRGRLHIALLPLPSLMGWDAFIAAWRNGEGRLRLTVSADGSVESEIGGSMRRWQVAVTASAAGATTHHVEIAAPPTVLVLGAGPETPMLLPLLRSLGWMTTLVERRPRWRLLAAAADVAVEQMPESALRSFAQRAFDAALVMHHNFELDREALAALAASDIAFIGLLGPVRRREDLFRMLSADERVALQPRLHSPIGLKLGGHGPEAIALSIAAQLQTLQQQPYRQVP
ncbi:XdhC/CoxI family protein [Lysobacter sp. CFH 32150]|uniref:XdhC family protein n=1 Tax=Lysobacter sp. CFH 32150 TaxID=2927128 RepID=UPI001FA7E353|nr:XdhC/CoxI family protein [Lysobacter sp. CFH 32150]MCI4568213.1 XdhC family protein [Lysobacter sp. CFH 32150]